MKNLALTDRQTEAMDLHYQIKNNGELAATAMVEFCKGLKRMRDEKLYVELGHATFEEYCEVKVQMGQSQAYTYIQALEKLGSTFLQSSGNLGITKLKLLTMINPVERAEIIESGQIDEMSTREMEALVKKLTEKEEQLSLIAEEKETMGKDLDFVVKQNDDWKETVEILQKELKELKSKPTPIAVSEPDPAEMKKKIDGAVSKAVADERKKFAEEKAAAVKRAEDESKKAFAKSIDQMSEQKKELAERAAELEKKLKLSANPGTMKFSFYFDAFQNNFNELTAVIKEADEELSGKLNKALGALLTTMCESILPAPEAKAGVGEEYVEKYIAEDDADEGLPEDTGDGMTEDEDEGGEDD